MVSPDFKTTLAGKNSLLARMIEKSETPLAARDGVVGGTANLEMKVSMGTPRVPSAMICEIRFGASTRGMFGGRVLRVLRVETLGVITEASLITGVFKENLFQCWFLGNRFCDFVFWVWLYLWRGGWRSVIGIG